MSDLILAKLLANLGLLCFEFHSEGFFTCLGMPPDWAMDLFPCVRNQFPKILASDISPFLENFMVDAKAFWQTDAATIMRSGYWTESVVGNVRSFEEYGADINLEALALKVEQRCFVLIEVSRTKFFETFQWLQTARKERLAAASTEKMNVDQMRRASLFDPLTGLPNERSFVLQLAQTLSQIRQQPSFFLLLVRVKVDCFCELSLTLGGDRKNRCLLEIGRRLSDCQPHAAIARLAEDEFILAIHEGSDQDAEQRVQALMAKLRSPYRLGPNSIYLTFSLGARCIASTDESPEVLMQSVALAQLQARRRGRGQYCFFDSEDGDRELRQVQLEQGLLNAIEQQQLTVMFQLIGSREKHQWVGLEPIIEWSHPDLGLFEKPQIQALATAANLSGMLAIYLIRALDLLFESRPKRGLMIVLPLSVLALGDQDCHQCLMEFQKQLLKRDRLILKLYDIGNEMTVDLAKLLPSNEMIMAKYAAQQNYDALRQESFDLCRDHDWSETLSPEDIWALVQTPSRRKKQ